MWRSLGLVALTTAFRSFAMPIAMETPSGSGDFLKDLAEKLRAHTPSDQPTVTTAGRVLIHGKEHSAEHNPLRLHDAWPTAPSPGHREELPYWAAPPDHRWAPLSWWSRGGGARILQLAKLKKDGPVAAEERPKASAQEPAAASPSSSQPAGPPEPRRFELRAHKIKLPLPEDHPYVQRYTTPDSYLRQLLTGPPPKGLRRLHPQKDEDRHDVIRLVRHVAGAKARQKGEGVGLQPPEDVRAAKQILVHVQKLTGRRFAASKHIPKRAAELASEYDAARALRLSRSAEGWKQYKASLAVGSSDVTHAGRLGKPALRFLRGPPEGELTESSGRGGSNIDSHSDTSSSASAPHEG